MDFSLEIEKLLGDKTLHQERIGLSGASVWICDDFVLKAEPESPESRNAAGMMTWLEGKVSAPRLLNRVIQDGMDYQLMSRLPGTMACDPHWMRQPQLLAQKLAWALKELW